MNRIELPSLVGDQPATYLAALGVLALTAQTLGDDDATLRWSDPSGPATVTTSVVGTLDDLGSALADVAVRMAEADELLPGAGAEFPPRKAGKEADPTRQTTAIQLEPLIADSEHLATGSGWLHAVFGTNSATSSGHKSPGVMLRHPLFDAGPGTVSMSTTLQNSRDAAARRGAVAASLRSPRRVASSIGGYLDWRADRDASQAASADDKRTSLGDPVLAWLGLMSIRLTTVMMVGDRAVSALTPPVNGRFLRKPLVWPVWDRALIAVEVSSLLRHSAIHRVEDVLAPLEPGRRRPRAIGVRLGSGRSDAAMRSLGVVSVFASSRLSKGNNDGAYGPPVRVWPEA